MTIAFINSTRKWGGVKSWTLDFGEALARRGHRVAVVARAGTPFVSACREQGLRVHALRFGPKYNPFAIGRVVRILRAERPDVAVVNISRDLDVGAVAARLCRIPVVHRVGLVEDFRGTREERWRHRLLVDAVLVPSRYLREGLLSAFPWMASKPVHVIPNSKRLDRYRRAAPPSRPALVFGVSSQLSPSKGHTVLFQAVEMLRKRGVALEVRVLGTGPHEPVLRAEVETRGLDEVVRFVGFRTDVAGFLADLDAYVLPSLKESFSNAVLEAMCCGLPVVASAAGGVPEVVGEAGLLVPPEDPEALAEALERLVRSPELRDRLGRSARERAEECFDLERNAGVLEALFEEMRRR